MNLAGVKLGPPCPSCRDPMVQEKGRFGPYFVCPRRSNYHSAHADGRPMGVPGDRETRAARRDAHVTFDRLWRSGTMSRRSAYRWMREALGLSEREAHIGRFTVEQCRRLVDEVVLFERRLLG